MSPSKEIVPSARLRTASRRKRRLTQEQIQPLPRRLALAALIRLPTFPPLTLHPPLPHTSEPDSGKAVEQDVAVQNKAALFYLDQGMALRNDGDMQGALGHFNSAASLEKDHPRILYEFAITYEEMGLSNKATNFWKSIYQMGRVRSGDYFSLADFRLKGQGPEIEIDVDNGSPAAEAEQNLAAANTSKRILKVASAVAERDDTVAEGERIVLNVLIKSSNEATINPEYVHVRVDFYDKVNEDMVDLTRAVPANRWVTQPVDWRNQSEELLEVTYFLPPQLDQEILDFGHRTYHGYIVKIYYYDQLQDATAEPASLLDSVDFGAPLSDPAPAIDESFFPR